MDRCLDCGGTQLIHGDCIRCTPLSHVAQRQLVSVPSAVVSVALLSGAVGAAKVVTLPVHADLESVA